MADLLLCVENSSLPVQERLKEVKSLWKRKNGSLSPDVTSSLLRWTCLELCQAYSKKNRTRPSHDTTGALWQFLSQLVEVDMLNGSSLSEDGSAFTIHLFQGMSVVFSAAAASLGKDGSLSLCAMEASKCLWSILKLPELPSALMVFETLVGLLEHALELSVACCGSAHLVEGLREAVLCALGPLLELYVYVDQIQGNRKKVFSATCQQLLCPCLQLYSSLHTQGTSSECVAIETAVTSGVVAIFKSLFQSDVLSEYSSTLSSGLAPPSDSTHKKGGARTAVSSTSLFFEILDQFLSSEGNRKAVKALPVFFQVFLTENSTHHKVPKSIEFNFLVRIVQLLGVLDDSAQSLDGCGFPTDPTPQDLEHVLTSYHQRKCEEEEEARLGTVSAYQQCLELLVEYDVYQVAEDSQKQTDFLRGLIRSMMGHLRPSSGGVWCGCVLAMLRLNHMLVEPWLSLLWALLPSLQPHSNKLMMALGETYFKLRQLPLLFEKKLSVPSLLFSVSPEQANSSSPCLALPPCCETPLRHHVATLPPGQATQILQLYAQHLQAWCGREGVVREEVGMAMAHCIQELGVVLTHLPSSLWHGRHSTMAEEALRSLVEEGCGQMMALAKRELLSPPPRATPLSVSTLLLTSCCCDLLTCLKPHPPASGQLPDWPLQLEPCPSHSHLLLLRVWVSKKAVPILPAALVLLKQLAVQQFKFDAMNGGPENQLLLDFMFHSDVETVSSGVWNGQLLSASAGECAVGHWAVVLSQLPHLYHACSTDHIRILADVILLSLTPAILPGSSSDTTQQERVELVATQQQGVELAGVVSTFLQSECFVEMRELHEMLVLRYFAGIKCKGVASPVKGVVKLCVGTVGLVESEAYSSALTSLLNHGFDTLRHTSSTTPSPPSSTSYSYDRLMWKLKLAVYVPLMKALSGTCLRVSVLLKAFPMGLAYHVALLQLLVQPCPHSVEIQTTLCDLTYLLVWLLRALLASPVARRTAKAYFSSAELGLLLQWWFKVMQALHHQGYVHTVEACMVAMEMTLALQLSSYGYPSQFANMLLEFAAPAVPADPAEPVVPVDPGFLAGRTVLMLAELCCGGKLKETSLCHQNLLLLVLSCVEVCLMKDQASLLNQHPHVLSALAQLLKLDPSASYLPRKRIAMVARQLWTFNLRAELCEGEGLLTAFHKFSAQLDCYAIVGVALSGSSSPAPKKSEMELRGDEEAGMEWGLLGLELRLARVWHGVQEVLVGVVSGIVGGACGVDWLRLTACTLRGHWDLATVVEDGKEGGGGGVVGLLIGKIVAVLSCLVGVASCEDVEEIVAQVEGQLARDTQSSLVYCLCWCVLLEAKLSQKLQLVLRPCLHQVVVQCLAIARQHPTQLGLVAMTTGVVERIMSIPPQQGLHKDVSVLTALQLCVLPRHHGNPNTPEALRCLEMSLLLMLSILRQHSSVLDHTPAPFVMAINNLVVGVVRLGQRRTEESSDMTTPLVCARLLSRGLEMLARHKALCKFYLPVLHEYLVSIHHSPLDETLQVTMWAGVFSLLRLCGPAELAALRACLDPQLRDSLQTLLKHFKTAFKLGGRV